MNNKEIGSEFSYQKTEKGSGIFFPNIKDYSFAFSGRTAIETVIRNESIKKVLMPSYCCDSMIDPFRKAGIELSFYPVNYLDELHIDISIPDDIDCFFWCNYFGFMFDFPQLSDFKSRGGVVIEDITHSLLSERQYHKQSDYIVASIRKWLPVLCGGYVGSIKNELKKKPIKDVSEIFLHEKIKAMQVKQSYLDGDSSIEKTEFLNLFSKTNHFLAKNYLDMMIDELSLSMITTIEEEKVRKQRKNNAEILYEGLKEEKKITFLFPYNKMDCPLFVPIVIKNGRRDLICKKLIEHSIYCPVHWPKPKANCESNLYDMELSLVCDQRYNEKDMQRIVNILLREKWENN